MMRVEDLETPVPVIDLDRVEHNLSKLQAYCDSHTLRLRPHIKTHKIPAMARRQLELGACGITCQKLGEAEVMADAGIDDILISYPLIGPVKAMRLAALADRATMRVAVDNPLALETAAQAARASGKPIGVLVEFDSGNKRTGVVSVEQALGSRAAYCRYRGAAVRRVDDLSEYGSDGDVRGGGEADVRRGRAGDCHRVRRRHAEGVACA